jgi:hypothetical protein
MDAPSCRTNDADWHVPSEIVSRLLRAGEHEAAAIVAALSPRQRAHLAVFCYARTHLHRIGLAIAATCDQLSLMNASASIAAGHTLYAQSRDRTQPIERPVTWRRPITLARSASGNSKWTKLLADIVSEETESGDAEAGSLMECPEPA